MPLLVDLPYGGVAVTGVLAGVTLGAGTLVAGLQRRFGPWTAVVGAGLGTVGFAAAAAFATTGALPWLVVAAPLLGAGGGLCLAAGLTLTARLAAPGRLGALTSLFLACAYIGFAAPFVMAVAARAYVGDRAAGRGRRPHRRARAAPAAGRPRRPAVGAAAPTNGDGAPSPEGGGAAGVPGWDQPAIFSANSPSKASAATVAPPGTSAGRRMKLCQAGRLAGLEAPERDDEAAGVDLLERVEGLAHALAGEVTVLAGRVEDLLHESRTCRGRRATPRLGVTSG